MLFLEFLTVGNTKIKITLTAQEASARGINTEKTNYDDPEVRRNFRKILEEAKEKAGFDTGKEKVLIQAYPSRDGGIELFVTKLGVISKSAESMIAKSENVALLSKCRTYYIFENLENLLGAVRSISPEFAEDSSVYRLDDGTYCLVFCERTPKYVLSELSVLSEFGRKSNELPTAFLKEHACLLRKGDAIEVFSEL